MSQRNIYLVATIVTIGLILMNQAFIQYWLHSKEEDAMIINIGGRQRMFSQRMLALCYDYKNDPQQSTKSELVKVKETWSQSHKDLIKIFEEQSTLVGDNISIISQLNELTPLITKGRQFSEELERLSVLEWANFKTNQDTFLIKMNNIVNQLEEESSRKLTMVIRIEIFFAILSLLVVFYEIIYIFRRINIQLNHQNNQLLESNQLLEEYAYLAAHDLFTPVQNIENFTRLLRRKLKSKLDATTEKYFEFILDAVQISKHTTHDLLAFSTINNQKIFLENFDLGELLETVFQEMKHEIDASRATIIMGRFQGIVTGDKNLLSLVFKSLISNGIKFVGEGVQPEMYISYTEYQSSYIIDFKDNGIGIDPQYYQKIFGLFKRLHQKHEYSGRGVGLAICKKILDKHQGEIIIEKAPTNGSIFKVKLPKRHV